QGKWEGKCDGVNLIIPVIADVRCAWHDAASYLRHSILADAGSRRGGRCRAWRARWRWPSGIAIGANQPITNQSSASSHFDWLSVTEVVNISPNAYPRTIGQVGSRFIEGGWELTGSVSYEEPDKKIRRRYRRGRNGSGDKCVCALLRDYT